MVDENKISKNMDEVRGNETKICSRCGRELPIERFSNKLKKGTWCKNCCSTYTSEKNGYMSEESIVKIERLYKEPFPERILDTKQAGIELISPDECFVQLINYKKAWISNYGRPLEYNNGKYVIKRTKENESGEKICTLQKNVYDGEKWVWQKHTIEVWRLVVSSFIVNFDMVGNTHCWHKDNDKADNYYKNICPMNNKQYNAVLDRYTAGVEITDELIYEIVNDILYKADDWYANKWKRTVFGVGYLGCSDAEATRDNYIYSKWANMMQRCYDEETHRLKPYYALCTAEIEWHNFSNYREWHKENAMGDRKLDLDKDILVRGNTVYGSETCTLIPHFTNTVFETTKGIETNIVYKNETGKYDVTMSVLGKREEVGTFATEEKAKQEFIAYKQDYIRKFAQKCKGKVPDKTYEAMMNWEIEITD